LYNPEENSIKGKHSVMGGSPSLTRRGWGGFGEYINTPPNLLLQRGGFLQSLLKFLK
jgi:hypothetical protein